MTRKPTALVVEDEPQMRWMLGYALEAEGIAPLPADNGATALNLLHTREIDLVLLDVGLPGMDGLTLCRRIRKESDVPIMIVTCLSEQEEVIAGLEHGADDYVARPFHPRVVALRAKNLLRRRTGDSPGPGKQVMHVGALRIDPGRHEVHIAGRPIRLTPTEFDLLAHLAAHGGTPQSWQTLYREVWGAQHSAGGRDAVKTAICTLRSALAEADPDTHYILNQRRVGYYMADPLPASD